MYNFLEHHLYNTAMMTFEKLLIHKDFNYIFDFFDKSKCKKVRLQSFFAAKMQYEMEKKLYQQECHLKLNEQGFL